MHSSVAGSWLEAVSFLMEKAKSEQSASFLSYLLHPIHRASSIRRKVISGSSRLRKRLNFGPAPEVFRETDYQIN